MGSEIDCYIDAVCLNDSTCKEQLVYYFEYYDCYYGYYDCYYDCYGYDDCYYYYYEYLTPTNSTLSYDDTAMG